MTPGEMYLEACTHAQSKVYQVLDRVLPGNVQLRSPTELKVACWGTIKHRPPLYGFSVLF